MDLMHGCQPLDRQAKPGGDAAPVFEDLVTFVAGAEADIEATIQPFGNASGSGETTVEDSAARRVVQQRAFDRCGRGRVLPL
jgi:hypothetical protein